MKPLEICLGVFFYSYELTTIFLLFFFFESVFESVEMFLLFSIQTDLQLRKSYPHWGRRAYQTSCDPLWTKMSYNKARNSGSPAVAKLPRNFAISSRTCEKSGAPTRSHWNYSGSSILELLKHRFFVMTRTRRYYSKYLQLRRFISILTNSPKWLKWWHPRYKLSQEKVRQPRRKFEDILLHLLPIKTFTLTS